jgi:16S rRNA (cytosine1402-N4)-methyltransferase
VESDERARHVPVLLAETLHWLEPARGGVFIDCTLGLGGHSQALLEGGVDRLLALDRDPRAIARARVRLERFGERVLFIEAEFGDLRAACRAAGVEQFDGLLADLGVSSMQIDLAERGFSFQREGPLDMRMGREGTTAGDIVNDYSAEQLERIFREHGEERDARRVARAIVSSRERAPIETTLALRETILSAKRGRERDGQIDAATRVFQALRIEVNQELEQLRQLMDDAVKMLSGDGKLVLISYHSLEDRIVKNALRDFERGEIDQVTGRPHAETRLIEVLTRKPVRPTEEEIATNPRARSARLRAARRL